MKNFFHTVQPYFQHERLILIRYAGFTYISWTITDQALAGGHKSYPLPSDCASLIPYVERTEGYGVLSPYLTISQTRFAPRSMRRRTRGVKRNYVTNYKKGHFCVSTVTPSKIKMQTSQMAESPD